MELTSQIIIFILACIIGYYIIWGVTPSLHAPLMSVSNAISGIIIIGAINTLNQATSDFSFFIALVAILVSAINVFGGFAISQRMLEMFKPEKKRKNK